MYQLLRILEENTKSSVKHKPTITLLCANRSVDDILLRSELEQLQERSTTFMDFRIMYVVNDGNVTDKNGTHLRTSEDVAPPHTQHDTSNVINKKILQSGRQLDEALLKTHFENELPEAMVFVCGPPSFMRSLCGERPNDWEQGRLTGALRKLGCRSEQVFKF